jgi:enoyl-CoA hydratase
MGRLNDRRAAHMANAATAKAIYRHRPIGMAFENIRYEERDRVGTLTFTREKALNALNRATLDELATCLAQAGASRAISALILTGAGEKAFVAGADISELKSLSSAEAEAFATSGQKTLAALEELPIPTIAALNGFALGGGLELAMSCDLIYASSRANLGQPEVNLGVIPGFGGTQRLLRRVGLMRAKELIFTADIIDAQKARELGLVLEVFEPSELQERVRAIALKLATKSRIAVAESKRVLEFGADRLLAEANREEAIRFGALFGQPDQREGMAAFVEKRPARFTS